MPPVAIGIDLGTTYSCVGIWRNDRVEIIANDMGSRTTPSYVSFTETERLLGEAAKVQVAMNPKNTIFDAKRLIGRRFDDKVLQEDLKHLPFKVNNRSGNPVIEVTYKGEVKEFLPEEISSMVLTKMRETAEDYLGTKVQTAVITVPAYFNDSQRQATKNAGIIAGLNIPRVINEPTAAAIAYRLDNPKMDKCNILVFDLGGGTFDVSLLHVKKDRLKVLAVAGDTHLGGEDFDNRLVNHCVKEFKRKYKKDLSGNGRAMRRLRSMCERAKCMLSSAVQTTIEIDMLFEGIDFNYTISRARFEEMNQDLFRKTIQLVEKVLQDAKLEKRNISDIVMVGGSTRIPKIQKMVSEFFNGKELSKSINPDEAVAYGAAVLAAKISGDKSKETKNLQLKDVVPLSLGCEEMGGIMLRVINRNTRVPAKGWKEFWTVKDNQTSILFQVFEGESYYTKDNNLLGKFKLTGIPPARVGVYKIDVHFEMDIDGILHISAQVRGTKQRSTITIHRDRGQLSNDELDRMRRDSVMFQSEDALVREKNQAKNRLEARAYSLMDADGHSELKELAKQVLDWIEDNPLATKAEYEKQQVQLDNLMFQGFKKGHHFGAAKAAGSHLIPPVD